MTKGSREISDYSVPWYGMQTIENTPAIAARVEHMLRGRYYTFAARNDGFDAESSIGLGVRTRQTIKPSSRAVSCWVDSENTPPKYAGFNVGDSYGVWGASTSTNDEKYDHTFSNPYFVFDYTQIRIVQRAPAGHLLAWVIAIEE